MSDNFAENLASGGGARVVFCCPEHLLRVPTLPRRNNIVFFLCCFEMKFALHQSCHQWVAPSTSVWFKNEDRFNIACKLISTILCDWNYLVHFWDHPVGLLTNRGHGPKTRPPCPSWASWASLPMGGLLRCWFQRLETVETAVESVQTDVRQLTEERDNVRNTFNDLTLKLINSQVSWHHVISL